MKKFISILLFIFLIIPGVGTAAKIYEEGLVCVKYQRKDLTYGKTYQRPYIVADGRYLNETASTSKYNNNHNYAVVYWPNGGYSAVDIGSQQILFYSKREGRDQSGRPYILEKSFPGNSCY